MHFLHDKQILHCPISVFFSWQSYFLSRTFISLVFQHHFIAYQNACMNIIQLNPVEIFMHARISIGISNQKFIKKRAHTFGSIITIIYLASACVCNSNQHKMVGFSANKVKMRQPKCKSISKLKASKMKRQMKGKICSMGKEEANRICKK